MIGCLRFSIKLSSIITVKKYGKINKNDSMLQIVEDLVTGICSWVWWLTLVVLPSQEVKTGRIEVQGHLNQ
jgi:hypothetical protein